MISHVSFGVKDVEKSAVGYDKIMAVIGAKRQKEVVIEGKMVAIGYGQYYPIFWIGLPQDGKPATAGNGVHVAFCCGSNAKVDEFYQVAMANGFTDGGKPGPRPQYSDKYYGAFFFDSDGNKIEGTYFDLGIWGYCNIQ